MEVQFDQTWSTTGLAATSGVVGAAVRVWGSVQQSAMYVEVSTGTTGTFQLQTAQESSGPWFAEGTTSVNGTLTAAAAGVMRFTGPLTGWVRANIQVITSGAYNVRIVGTG